MGNNEPYQSRIKDVNQVYQIYSQSLKQSHKGIKYHAKWHQPALKQMVDQLFQSFDQNKKYSWGEEMKPLIMTHFHQSFQKLWTIDRQKFYKLIIDYSGKIKTQNLTYQQCFYEHSIHASKLKSQNIFEGKKVKLQALNHTIVDQGDEIPVILTHSKKLEEERSYQMSEYLSESNNNQRRYNSVNDEFNRLYSQSDELNMIRCRSEFKNMDEQTSTLEIERSSVIIPETVFVNRLQQNERSEVADMLSFYKIFSNALQQLIKSLSLISCPIKHFQTSLKKKLKDKKIVQSGLNKSLIKSHSKKSLVNRKKHEYNNALILYELRDFLESYTEFIWKYLHLFEIQETQYRLYITIETVYGIALKIVWNFIGWIGERGYQHEEMQLPRTIKKISKHNDKGDKIVIPDYIIQMGCNLCKQTSPQKYLKKIVLIYREMSKNCESADKLLLQYETLIYSIIRTNCHDKLLRMHNIISKIMKLEESNGQICYAWTTWCIIIELIKSYIKVQMQELEILKGFQIIA